MDEVEQQIKIGIMEERILSLTQVVGDLKKALTKHMVDEERDRRELDKKLNLHTIILVIVGLSTLGGDLSSLLPVLKALVGL